MYHGLEKGLQDSYKLWFVGSVSDAVLQSIKAQELCESRGGRPGLPVPKSPYGLCGRKATLNMNLNSVH